MALTSIAFNTFCRNSRSIYKSVPCLSKQIMGLSSQPELDQLSKENQKIEVPKLDVLNHKDYFQVYNLFTIKDLFDARVHYGHKVGSMNSKMTPFIFGSRLGHLIFDLDITAQLLRDALNVTAHIAYLDGIILFLGRGPQHTQLIEATAKECESYAHTRFWAGGVFTNTERQFGTVTRLPDLCIFIKTLHSFLKPHRAIIDSAKMAIPTIGIVDSNCDPNIITYPVPGNDDSTVAIELYCKLFKEAILRGKAKRKEHLEKGILSQ